MPSASATGIPHIGCCAPTRGFWKQGAAGSTALLARCCPGSGPGGSWHHLWCCSTAIRTHPAANTHVPTAACLGTHRNLVADREGSQKEARDQRASIGAREGITAADCCQWQEERCMSHRSPPKTERGAMSRKGCRREQEYQILVPAMLGVV